MFASSQVNGGGGHDHRQQSAQPLPPSSLHKTPAELARKVFISKHGLQLAPDVIPWLDTLARHFQLENDESEMLDTFEHLVKGVLGTGSGLGTSRRVLPPRLSWADSSHLRQMDLEKSQSIC